MVIGIIWRHVSIGAKIIFKNQFKLQLVYNLKIRLIITMISKKFFKNLVLLLLFLANTRMLLSMDNPLENSFDFVPYHNDLTAKVVNLGQNVAVSGHKNGKIIFWDVQKRKVKSLFWGHRALVKTLLFSPDCRAVVSLAVDDTLILWDVVMCHKICELVGHSAHISSVAFSPDSRFLVSGSYDDTVRLWEVVTGQCIYVFSNKDCGDFQPRLILDGKILVEGVWSDTVKFHDSIGGCCSIPFGGNGGVESVIFSKVGFQIKVKLLDGNFVTYSDMLFSRAIKKEENKSLADGLKSFTSAPDAQPLTFFTLYTIYHVVGVTPWKDVFGIR